MAMKSERPVRRTEFNVLIIKLKCPRWKCWNVKFESDLWLRSTDDEHKKEPSNDYYWKLINYLNYCVSLRVSLSVTLTPLIPRPTVDLTHTCAPFWIVIIGISFVNLIYIFRRRKSVVRRGASFADSFILWPSRRIVRSPFILAFYSRASYFANRLDRVWCDRVVFSQKSQPFLFVLMWISLNDFVWANAATISTY